MSSFVRNLRYELPSMESLGFRQKAMFSYPFLRTILGRPAISLLLVHFEEHFPQYMVWRLEKFMPHFEDIVKRWWRRKFIYFIRREYRLKDETVPKPLKDEEEYFGSDDDRFDLRAKWNLHKTRILLLESRRDRFGKNVHDFETHLQKEWFRNHKYKYMVRELGLREEPFWRAIKKSKTFRNLRHTLWHCWHWNCWKVRIKLLPLVPFMWTYFKLYGMTHPELMEIH